MSKELELSGKLEAVIAERDTLQLENARVRQETIEECAKVCEIYEKHWAEFAMLGGGYHAAAAANLGKSIRSLPPAAKINDDPYFKRYIEASLKVERLQKELDDLAGSQPDRAIAPSSCGDVPAVIAKLDKAMATVSDLCQGRIRWTMRVPAEPDRDPDLIIADALSAAKAALSTTGPMLRSPATAPHHEAEKNKEGGEA